MSNPLVAFVLGFVSHFIVDLIPHGDENIIVRGPSRKRYITKLLAIVALDGTFLTTLVLLWYTSHVFTNPISAAWAIFGSILPDALQGITELTDHRFLNRYQRFHHQFHIAKHTRWAHVRLPFKIGLPLQIIFWFLVQRGIGS